MEVGTFKLRDYQADLVKKARRISQLHGLVYLAMEVRTGKTFTALFTVSGSQRVLFVTKKKAIPSIEEDFKTSGLTYDLVVTNYESLHKLERVNEFDAVIVDEAHRLGAFPKRSKAVDQLREIISRSGCPTVLLSGTPTPESYSQIFHQLYISPYSPFKESNFYAWKNTYVDVKDRKIAYGRMIKDYSNAHDHLIKPIIEPYMLTYTQKQAGFDGEITERILRVKMNDATYKVANILKKDLVVRGKDQTIIADTPVKLQSKLHQIYSGTIKFEDGTRKVIDTSKADFIKSHFKGRKIAMFYKFKAEYDALKQVFGEELCDSISEFDSTQKHIALQIQSGREGTKLANADVLIFFNIDFSATSYWQGRDRMTTMTRKFNDVYWIFSEGGIEDKIYDMVSKKKSYTNYYFKRDYGLLKKKKKQTDPNQSKLFS